MKKEWVMFSIDKKDIDFELEIYNNDNKTLKQLTKNEYQLVADKMEDAIAELLNGFGYEIYKCIEEVIEDREELQND